MRSQTRNLTRSVVRSWGTRIRTKAKRARAMAAPRIGLESQLSLIRALPGLQIGDGLLGQAAQCLHVGPRMVVVGGHLRIGVVFELRHVRERHPVLDSARNVRMAGAVQEGISRKSGQLTDLRPGHA